MRLLTTQNSSEGKEESMGIVGQGLLCEKKNINETSCVSGKITLKTFLPFKVSDYNFVYSFSLFMLDNLTAHLTVLYLPRA
jgi:hypothetical protein